MSDKWELKKGTEDKGRWKEYINAETGESSIKQHVLKTVWQSCENNDHTYSLTGNREVTCSKCGVIKNFVLGIQTLHNGKLVPVKK